MGRPRIGVAGRAQGLTPMLIPEDPDDVGLFGHSLDRMPWSVSSACSIIAGLAMAKQRHGFGSALAVDNFISRCDG